MIQVAASQATAEAYGTVCCVIADARDRGRTDAEILADVSLYCVLAAMIQANPHAVFAAGGAR